MRRFSVISRFIALPALMLAFTGCAAIEGQESASAYADDSGITTRIKEAYLVDSQIKSFQIHVETMQGVVQLSGFVDTAANEQRAVHIAEQTSGVKMVKDDLDITPGR